jgi:hypothetical protein
MLLIKSSRMTEDSEIESLPTGVVMSLNMPLILDDYFQIHRGQGCIEILSTNLSKGLVNNVLASDDAEASVISWQLKDACGLNTLLNCRECSLIASPKDFQTGLFK